MKKTIVFILLSALFVSCKNNKEDFVIQKEEIDYTKKDSVIYIGNKKNRNYGFKKDTLSINLPELNYIDGKANYVFDAIYDEIFKHPIYEDDYKEIYAITKIKNEDFANTGLGFYLEDEPHIKYGFPLHSKVFNRDYFNKEIYNRINETLKVKVYASVYKRDNHSDLKTIVVDSVKLR
ncbi:MAG: hypothetical protein WCY06_05860 [Flavobacteriaceae bacterium]